MALSFGSPDTERLSSTLSRAARLSPKDAVNACTLFAVRASWERETSSKVAPSTTSSAQKAFDDLFKI